MVGNIRIAALAGASLLASSAALQAQDGIEGPQYNVLASAQGVELREYAPHLVAEVTVDADSMREASSRGFRPLAGYIFGNNQAADKIAMTAPVTTQPTDSGTKIAMTAPVTTAGQGDGRYTVRFSMPSKWTMETLPLPNDGSVNLVQVESEKRAAYRFTGSRSQDRIDEATDRLEAFLVQEDLRATSPVIVAGYDGPSVPMERKRWEVMVIVE